MNTSDIDMMLAEKGNPCISMIIPTARLTRERMENPQLIERAVLRARQLLANSTWPNEKIVAMNGTLDSIRDRIGYIRFQEGLAIFISPNVFKIELLPFPVKEKVMLGKNFEVRDLIYFSQFLKPYYLVALSKKRVRLFKGSGHDLQEIINDDFPKQYVEEYEYAMPSIGSSSGALKDFERDKSILQETRQKSFLKQADDTLKKYMKDDTPLFVAGVGEELANFSHLSHHVKKIAGKIAGNYDVDAVHPLAESAWEQIKKMIKTSQDELLLRLQENFGKQLAVDGMRNVWKAAKEGKGLTLLLEKDYQVTGYCDPLNDSHLYLTRPPGKYEAIMDAADEVISVVKEKGGNVVIVENGQLKEYEHVAMILRY
ncbi:MAG TPA: hypothetical protein VF141_10410 [Chryseolinea sp.]